jgi:hypothetical protein
MNPLPIESSDWLADFKDRIALERSIYQSLIQWGLTESVSDIHRMLEERLDNALGAPVRDGGPFVFQLSREQKRQFADALRDTYLKTRGIPRHGICQEKLHNALLTGFEDLMRELLQCYQEYLAKKTQPKATEEAA